MRDIKYDENLSEVMRITDTLQMAGTCGKYLRMRSPVFTKRRL
jgi:hypothetical protein